MRTEMILRGFVSVFLLTLLGSQSLTAQINLRLKIETYDEHPLQRAELLVQEGDSTILFSVIEKPEYILSLPKVGYYHIQLASPGYKTFQLEENFSTDTVLNVFLDRPVVALTEVVVEGKTRPRVTATGEVFTLSKKAKATGDPFRALSEIPLLEVDISSQSVKMRNGESPLVLIDGRLVNSGISPIHPDNIESVEISEVVSARYLQMGVTKIVNIRLRKNRPTYSYVDIRTRHDIPLREGFGGANFEFGQKKFAVSGSLFAEYLTNDRIRYEAIEQLELRKKTLSGTSTAKLKDANGNLLFKWVPSDSDYFSAFFQMKNARNYTDGLQEGMYTSDSNSASLKTSNSNKTRDGGIFAGFYHEHIFGNQNTLTTFFKYNYGFYDLNQKYQEVYDNKENFYLVDLATQRNQYALSIDYETGEKSFGSIAIGNNLEYTWDKIKNRGVDPLLVTYVGLWSNYTHATYNNQWKQLYYMASLGLQSLAVKVTDINHSYWRPRAALSLTYRLPYEQFLRGSYYLTNELPNSRTLVSFNQSTNPWFREEGNPYLKPMQIHQFSLSYDRTLGDFRFQVFGGHDRHSQMIESYIRQEGASQVKSYRNNGTYTNTNVGLAINCAYRKFLIFARTGYVSEVFNGQKAKGSYGVRGTLHWNFGDFFIRSNFFWRDRSYTAISETEYKNPTEAHIQIAWQVNKQLFVSLGLPYFWGTRSSETRINQVAYTSYQRTFYESASMRPWLLISWTIRKNAKLAIPRKMPALGDL